MNFIIYLFLKKISQGAWQPSLNISTVLTSVALLLSEPNPDDGLMCENCKPKIKYLIHPLKTLKSINTLLLDVQSREYKYDRQKFDQKARSWTEKYATGVIDTSKRFDEVIFCLRKPLILELDE